MTTVTWVATAPNRERYAGAEELGPICALYFDVLWDLGEHPYYGTVEEIAERLRDIADETRINALP